MSLSTAPLDADELDTVQALLGEEFDAIARIFLADSARRLIALDEAEQTADRLALEKISHILCGSSASLGATLLASHCREMETYARQGRLEQAGERLRAIRDEHRRIAARLQRMIGDT